MQQKRQPENAISVFRLPFLCAKPTNRRKRQPAPTLRLRRLLYPRGGICPQNNHRALLAPAAKIQAAAENAVWCNMAKIGNR